jgi:hypothetical protein
LAAVAFFCSFSRSFFFFFLGSGVAESARDAYDMLRSRDFFFAALFFCASLSSPLFCAF